jgi:hypothetical protein
MTRIIMLMLGGVLLVAAGAGATYYYELRLTPASIRSACRAFEAAYGVASGRAQRYNDEHLQSELAHPARASDDWHAAEKAKLEQGALILQGTRSSYLIPGQDSRGFSQTPSPR